MAEPRPINELAKKFNACLNKLINMAMNRCKTPADEANLDRLKKRIFLFRAESGIIALLNLAYMDIIQYADPILEKSIDAFMKIDTSSIADTDKYVVELFNSLKSQVASVPQDEIDTVFGYLSEMLEVSAEYALHKAAEVNPPAK